MPKIKYNVTDVDEGQDFDSPIPRGVYRCKVADATVGPSNASVERGDPKDQITVEFEITEKGDSKGRKLWEYYGLDESQEWKVAQLVRALGLRDKGTLDTDAMVGERVLIKVRHETDKRDPENPVVRARVGQVLNPSKLDEAADDAADDDDDDDDSGERAASNGELDELAYADLEAMDKDELAELVEEEELDVKYNSRTSEDRLRERVADELDLSADDDDDDADPDDDDDTTADDDDDELTEDKDVMAMGKAELVELIEDEDLDVSHNKRTKVGVLRTRVVEALEFDDDDDSDDDDEDYADMSVADLRTTAKSRGLATKGTKAALIKRLEKDDAAGDDPSKPVLHTTDLNLAAYLVLEGWNPTLVREQGKEVKPGHPQGAWQFDRDPELDEAVNEYQHHNAIVEPQAFHVQVNATRRDMFRFLKIGNER